MVSLCYVMTAYIVRPLVSFNLDEKGSVQFSSCPVKHVQLRADTNIINVMLMRGILIDSILRQEKIQIVYTCDSHFGR